MAGEALASAQAPGTSPLTEEQRDNLVRRNLTPDAIERLGGLGIVPPTAPVEPISQPGVAPAVPAAGPLSDLSAIPSLPQPIRTPEQDIVGLGPEVGAPLAPIAPAGGFPGSPELSGRATPIPAAGAALSAEQAAQQAGALDALGIDTTPPQEEDPVGFIGVKQQPPPPRPTPGGVGATPRVGALPGAIVTEDQPDEDPKSLGLAIEALDAQALVAGDEGGAIQNAIDMGLITSEQDLASVRGEINDLQSLINRTTSEAKILRDKVSAQEVDPDRFWKKKSTGQKIAAAIAIALGSFGAALAGGRNTAADIIQSAISDDIEAQKSDMLNTQRASVLVGNQLNQHFQRLKSLEAAEANVGIAARNRVLRQIESIEAGFTGEKAKAAAGVVKAQLTQKNEELELKVGLEVAKLLQKERAEQLKAAGRTPQTASGIVAKEGLNADALNRFVPSVENPSVGVLANTPKDKATVIKTREFVLNTRSAIAEMREIQQEAGPGGFEVLNRALVARSKAVGEAVVLQVKDLFALGALQQHERALIEQIVPANIVGIGELIGINTAKLLALEKLIEKMQENALRNIGSIDPDKPITGISRQEAAVIIQGFKPSKAGSKPSARANVSL